MTRRSKSQEIRAALDHPIIDSDGHTIEFESAILPYIEKVAGRSVMERYRAVTGNYLLSWQVPEPERRARRMVRPPFWAVPSENTLDRATAMLPRLLDERMDELGMDFTVLYPSLGLVVVSLPDEELRRAACRAFNAYHADLFAAHARRMTPAAMIPMTTPQEALDELERAVGELGMKAIMMSGIVRRPLEAATAISPQAAEHAFWIDTLGLDSAHDYDPVWRRCVELGVCPTFHSPGMGWGARRSISNYVYNHIGNFAAAGEATCKSLFLSGVTRRFPELRFAFLEGGVAWAAGLLTDLISHWEKRNPRALARLDPARLDREQLVGLFEAYGDEILLPRLQEVKDGAALLGDLVEEPEKLDEFAACAIARAEDVRDLFVPSFYFGCEADDPGNARAFDPHNPFAARLGAIFSSDIGHWDVPDMREVVAEAWELVEHGAFSESDFRDFTFRNAVHFWAALNRDFFAGTQVEEAAAEVLREG